MNRNLATDDPDGVDDDDNWYNNANVDDQVDHLRAMVAAGATPHPPDNDGRVIADGPPPSGPPPIHHHHHHDGMCAIF